MTKYIEEYIEGVDDGITIEDYEQHEDIQGFFSKIKKGVSSFKNKLKKSVTTFSKFAKLANDWGVPLPPGVGAGLKVIENLEQASKKMGKKLSFGITAVKNSYNVGYGNGDKNGFKRGYQKALNDVRNGKVRV